MTWWDAVKIWLAGRREEKFPVPGASTPEPSVEYNGAAEWLAKRANLTTVMGSRQIAEEWTAKARAQAFFSARVAEDHILERLRSVSDAYSRGKIGLAEARTELKRFLRAEGKDDGTSGLRNLASTARLDLILEQNARMAAAVGQYQVGMDPDIRERFPCWRYIGSTALNPRDSHARFAGKVFRKDDPIWHKIFPPSDFNCKCSVEDCDDEPDRVPEKIEPPESGFAFDPAHAFEEFDLSSIRNEELRKKTEEGIQRILSENKTSGQLQNGEKRKAQWQTAYQNRLERWEKETRKTGLKSEAVELLLECYTPEAAKFGKPPRIVANPGGKTYLTQDGTILYIGPDAKSPEDVIKKIGNLSHKLKRGKQYRIAKANRLKREAELIGANIIMKPHTFEQDLKASNPNFVSHQYKWTHNCQRCVTAYEARRRGLDVEAKPRGEMREPLARSLGWASAYKNGNAIDCSSRSGTGSRKKIIAEMERMPENVRCGVQVLWKGNQGGHVFIAEKQNGKIVFLDPQVCGKSAQLDAFDYFDYANGKECFIMRLDNLKFSDTVKECCKGVPENDYSQRGM